MDMEIRMPDLAAAKAEVEIVKWLVQPGQQVQRGQALVEVQTDKAVMEVESVATGVVKVLRAQPGDRIDAGTVIAVFEVEGSAPPAGRSS